MAKEPKTEPDDKEQSDRFIETAKKLEAAHDEAIFGKALDVVLNNSSKPKLSKIKGASRKVKG